MSTTRLLTPAAKPPPRFPIPAVVALAVASTLGFVTHGASSFLGKTVLGLAFAASALAGIVLGGWAEESIFARLSRRPRMHRLAGSVLAPLAGMVALIPAAVAGGVVAKLGDSAVLLAGLLVAALWMTGAAFGSLVVAVLDIAISAVVRGFRARIILAVMGLVLLVGASATAFGSFASAIKEGIAQQKIVLDVNSKGEEPKGGGLHVDADDSSGFDARGFADPVFLGSFIEFVMMIVAALFVLPWLLSACGKLADAVMERLHPLSMAFAEVADGKLDVRVEEAGSEEMVAASRGFNRMVESLELSHRMERAYGAYLGKQILERIRAQHGEAALPASSREVSVLFADIRGFTSMSEKLSPDAVLSVLNRYFERVVEVINGCEGYLNKFIGDAVVVVFNAPLDQPDHAARAVRCAMALQDAVAELNRANAFPEVGQLQVGVGIATGPAVAGNLGSARQMEYTVIGDTVNLASRLTSKAGPGEILLNEAAAAGAPADVAREALPPMSVKGKAQPVTAYRIAPAAMAAKIA